MKKFLTFPFIALIKFYQYLISPLIGPACRYHPSCSEYAKEAFEKFGVFKGGILSIKRLLRCHPWGGHGYDPVPEAKQKEKEV